MSYRSDPPARYAAVTPSDATVFGDMSRCLYVGGTGNVAVRTRGGDTVTFSAVPVGSFIIGEFDKVLSTGTTATLILRGW